MSEQSFKKKVASANKKVGRLLGRSMTVYRPVLLSNPIAEQNFVKTTRAAFSLDAQFTKTADYGFAVYTTYSDGEIQEGDIYVDDLETFVVIQSRGIEDVRAIRATHLISIVGQVWATEGGLQAKDEMLAENIPASIIGTSSKGSDIAGHSKVKAPILNWIIRIWAPSDQIKPSNNIVLEDGTRFIIESVVFTPGGYEITCREVR